MSNAGNAFGIMQILKTEHTLAKETYKKLYGAYNFTENNSSGKIEYNFHPILEAQIPRNFI